jgi:DNA-directed RNA polymerase subunit RPC12/RpoP
MGSPRACPHCGSTARTRSRRRVIEYLLPGLRPFRCLTCRRRFYGRKESHATVQAPYIKSSKSEEAPATIQTASPSKPETAHPWFLIEDLPPR